MGILQSLYNGLENVGAMLNGNFASFGEIIQSFVEGVRFDVGVFVKHRFYTEPKRIENFLSHQMVMLCEAESILRLRSALEVHGRREGVFGTNHEVLDYVGQKAHVVFCAMRHELDKHLKNPSYFPTFMYVFRNALDDITSISAMEYEEQRHLGFKIIEEYSTIESKIEKLNHDGIKSFYYDYFSKLRNLTFQCLENEETQIMGENGSIDVWRNRILPDWRELYRNTYSRYESRMVSVRLTDISKDYVKLF